MPIVIEVASVAAAVIVSLGGGGLIVLGLSSWLGKVWAGRMMELERAKHAEELERLRAELQHESVKSIESLKHEAEIYREKHLRGHGDKIAIYRLAVDGISELLANMDDALARANATGQPPAIPLEALRKFNHGRIQAYGYLAMFAPQGVIDAYDSLVERLLAVALGNALYQWAEIRTLALALLNQVRLDIGFDPSPIEYRGRL